MALPDGVTTCTVTYGKALGPLGTEASISARLTMDRKIVHAETGWSINPADEPVVPAAAGGTLSFQVPHVDQDGMIDASGEEVKNWYYVLSGTVVFPSKSISFQKVFQVFVGQTNVDLDVVPDGPALPGFSTPFPEVISVAGGTGAVGVPYLQEQLGVEPNTEDDATLAEEVARKLDADQVGQAGGAAPLDEDSSVPLVNLPDDVSTKVPAATTSDAGKVELATDAEVEAASDTTRVVTPAGLRHAISNGVVASDLSASYTQKPTTDLGDWALLRRDTSDVTKGVAWTTPEAMVARTLGWKIATDPAYGAVGDGAHDDTAAILAATAAGATWLPPGTFKTTATLTGGNDFALHGAGKGRTVVKGALGGTLIQSTDPATRYYRWHLSGFTIDNTSRATAGGIGLDLTNVSLSDVDVSIQNVETSLKSYEAAYYNLVHARVSGVVTVLKIGGATSSNQCEWHLRANDFTDGVIINNATNQTFIQPCFETFTGTAFDIAPSVATQYINLICPRFENVGGVGVGVRNRALAQATLWLGGMTTGLADDYINSAAAKEFMYLRPGQPNPETPTNVLKLWESANLRASIYANATTVFIRNGADSGYLGLDAGAITGRGTQACVTAIGSGATVGGHQIIARSAAGGYGAGIRFESTETGTSTVLPQALIVADGEGSWSSVASADSYLAFKTAVDGVLAEHWRIKSAGDLLAVAGRSVKMPAGAGVVQSGQGVTGSRPAAATAGVGAMWFDTTIGKPIWSTGSTWVLADGTAA